MSTRSDPLPPVALALKPDAAAAQNRLRAYWQGEIVDRACAGVRAPKDGAHPPRRLLIVAEDFDLPAAVDRFEEWAAEMFFGGECLPALMPNYGPDQWAGFLGAGLALVPEIDTSWAEPPAWDDERWPNLVLDPANRWWTAIVELTRLAAARCPGKFLVSALDTHSNLDCLAALRGPQQLCLDLADRPEQVARALAEIDALYAPIYNTIYQAGRMAEFGSTSWLEMWSPGRTQAVQCDFAGLISPAHFRRFALPSLEHELSCLDHAVYHMDGPGQIRHLDDLLALPGIHTIQWVPGAGQPPAPAWIELLQKIQRAGKGVQVLVSVEEAKTLYRALAPEKTYYWVLDCPSESEGRRLLDWMKSHT
jgi:5-methyltetrahydrofolate--homocysteine methyltransferase